MVRFLVSFAKVSDVQNPCFLLIQFQSPKVQKVWNTGKVKRPKISGKRIALVFSCSVLFRYFEANFETEAELSIEVWFLAWANFSTPKRQLEKVAFFNSSQNLTQKNHLLNIFINLSLLCIRRYIFRWFLKHFFSFWRWSWKFRTNKAQNSDFQCFWDFCS